MAKPIVYQWPAVNTTQVASTQNVAQNAPFLLNTPPLVYSGLPNQGQYILPNQQRKLTLTSTNNESGVGVNFVGTDLFGNAVSETLAGPNNNTVTTVNSYYTLTSAVPTTGALTAVSIGTGSSGLLSWVPIDSYYSISQVAVQTVVTGTINYSVFQTLDLPQDIINGKLITKIPTAFPIPSLNNDQSTPVYTPLTGLTANSFYAFPNTPLSAVVCVINSSAGGSLVFTVLQQGVN